MPDLDDLIHQPARLRIMSALTSLEPREQVDFSFLKEKLGLTDGNLGAHLRAQCRYLELRGHHRRSENLHANMENQSASLSPRGEERADHGVQVRRVC